MNFENRPWGDDIVGEFNAALGAEKLGSRIIFIVVQYLRNKFALPDDHVHLLARVSTLEEERKKIFQLLETKMPGRFKMISEEELKRALVEPPRFFYETG